MSKPEPKPDASQAVKTAVDATLKEKARKTSAAPAPVAPAPPAPKGPELLLENAHALLVKFHLTEGHIEDQQIEQLGGQLRQIIENKNKRWANVLKSIAASGRYAELDLGGTWQAAEGPTKDSTILRRLDTPKPKVDPA